MNKRAEQYPYPASMLPTSLTALWHERRRMNDWSAVKKWFKETLSGNVYRDYDNCTYRFDNE